MTTRPAFLVAATIAALLLFAGSVKSQRELFAVHGSGTTNPSKCFWLIMDQIMDRARNPVHLTYRAVGSSTGIAEFLGENNTAVGAYVPYNDFGSGDIPVPTEAYKALTATGQEMLHLPFALGAISIFHSIPGIPQGTGGLNLTSCLIAKIFRRKIVYWDNEEILDKNPNLEAKLPKSNYPIKLAHRVKGSSSTASVTEYLNISCPEEWDSEWVGATIDWPEEAGVLECEGSGGMTNCIRDNPGAIGYIDSGHGHSEGLIEIELENRHGTLLSSKSAAEEDGIASAADNTVLPTGVDQDFGHLNFLDKEGEFTWPIVTMSYVFVRKDITYIENPIEQGLLVAFLQSLYDKDTFDQCTQFGFTPAPESVSALAIAGVNNIGKSADAPTWRFETKTDAGRGQEEYVISVKRRSFAEYERSQLMSQIESLQKTNTDMATQVASLTGDGGSAFTDKDQTQLTAALTLASISFALWAILIIGMAAKMCFGEKKQSFVSEVNGEEA